MTPADVRAVPGAAECALDDATLAELPPDAPRAPWHVECDSIIWCTRGGRAAALAAGDAARGTARAPGVVGGLVSYRRTPVGTYHEVLGMVAIRRGRRVHGTIPFMAVDSRDSLVGGRQNWSLPKCLARFTGEPIADATMTARGVGWELRATARPFGPSYPMPVSGRLVQAWPDGRLRASVLTGRAHARSAVVTVEVASDGSLASWLRPGRHLGAALSDVTFTLPAPH
jgi:hypothetical protein